MGFERAKAAVTGTRFADLRWVPETGSTNTDALTAVRDATARGGAVPDLVVVTDHQSAGRGRLGRVWQAPPGASLLMTVAFAADPAPERRPLALTALGVSAAESIAVTTGASLGLKWPNDLVTIDSSGAGAADRKVAGILAEVHGSEAGDVELVGIGINCNWPEVPDELAGVAASLNALAGTEIDREALAADLLVRFAERMSLLGRPRGPEGLTEQHRERTATLGRRVRVELPGSELTGIAADVTVAGALLVDGDDGRRHTVTVGDVVHLRPAD